MKSVALRPEGAKKPASIPPEASSPLLVIDPKAPEFEHPDPSSLPPDDAAFFPESGYSDVSPLFRPVARRALNLLGSHLRSCPHEEIHVVALKCKCHILGSICVAQGGLSRIQIALPDLVAKARLMGAAGILLLQNRPGSIYSGVPIDVQVSITIAFVCELLGMPLVDHLYINTRGEPLSVRARGILKPVPELVTTLRERSAGIVKQAAESGIGEEDYFEQKAADRTAIEECVRVEVITRRRRRQGAGE